MKIIKMNSRIFTNMIFAIFVIMAIFVKNFKNYIKVKFPQILCINVLSKITILA